MALNGRREQAERTSRMMSLKDFNELQNIFVFFLQKNILRKALIPLIGVRCCQVVRFCQAYYEEWAYTLFTVSAVLLAVILPFQFLPPELEGEIVTAFKTQWRADERIAPDEAGKAEFPEKRLPSSMRRQVRSGRAARWCKPVVFRWVCCRNYNARLLRNNHH